MRGEGAERDSRDRGLRSCDGHGQGHGHGHGPWSRDTERGARSTARDPRSEHRRPSLVTDDRDRGRDRDRRRIGALAIVLSLWSASARADSSVLSIEASVSDTQVMVGDILTLQVTAVARAEGEVNIVAPQIDG